MRGGGGTAGLAQIAQLRYAHCSVDLNEDGGKSQRKKHRWMEYWRGVMRGRGHNASRWSRGNRHCYRETKIKRCTMQKNQNGDVCVIQWNRQETPY